MLLHILERHEDRVEYRQQYFPATDGPSVVVASYASLDAARQAQFWYSWMLPTDDERRDYGLSRDVAMFACDAFDPFAVE